MTTTDTPSTALVPSPAVNYNLDNWPVGKYNRLIPTQTIAMPTDLMRPVIQIVVLDDEGDTYKSKDVPDGSRAISKVGLRKLATAAGIAFIDERRTDDGTDPDVCEVTCFAEMTLPTGQRLRAPGMKRISLAAQSWASANQRAKYKSFLQEHVASRAENRAIRALLSLKASYTNAELARPFAVVSFAPNMDHPEVRARILEAMAPTVAAVYGPAAAPQLTAGTPIDVSPAPDDEEAGRAPDAPDAPTGEDEPGWFASDPGPQGAADFGPSFADRIRSSASSSGMKGPATLPQLEQLRAIFGPIGGPVTLAGIRVLWPAANPNALTAGCVQALILAADSDPAFAAHWAELAGEAAA